MPVTRPTLRATSPNRSADLRTSRPSAIAGTPHDKVEHLRPQLGYLAWEALKDLFTGVLWVRRLSQPIQTGSRVPWNVSLPL